MTTLRMFNNYQPVWWGVRIESFTDHSGRQAIGQSPFLIAASCNGINIVMRYGFDCIFVAKLPFFTIR